MKKNIVMLMLITISLSSCYTNYHTVGTGPSSTTSKNRKEKYSAAKQLYLIAGLFPLGNASPDVPADGNYIIKDHFNFTDFLITGLTFGLLGARTETIYVTKK